MSQSHMEVFNEFYMEAINETLAQDIDKFNASSNGTIRLASEGFTGDFLEKSFFQSLAASRRRVDRYAANTDVAATDLTEQRENGVKVAGGFGPIRFEPSQMTWLKRPTQQAIEAISSQFSALLIQDKLNTAIAGAVAAIGNNTNAVNDVSATDQISYAAVNAAHAKFGDSSSLIAAQVMDGLTYHKFVGDNLANTERLFEAKGVMIIDILGKPVIVTDAPALFETGTPNVSNVLSLVEGAVVVYDPSDLITNIETKNGKERIETTFQTDDTFGLSIKSYSWDQTTGGKSPLDAALATGANWNVTVSDVKNTAGVLTKGQHAA